MLRIVNRSKDRGGCTGTRGLYTSAPPMSTHGLVPSAAEPGPPLDRTIFGLVHNEPFPAVPSDGRHAYASRPLPRPPPPRVKLSVMPPLRPGNSSGKATTLRPDFETMERRISRDDMFLRPTTGRAAIDSRRISRDDSFLVGRQASSWRPGFHIPNRGQLTPDLSSRGASPPNFPPPFRRRETSESLRSAEIPIGIGMPIGMAIGSPTQAAGHSPANFANSWRPQMPQVQEIVRPEPEPELEPVPEPEPEPEPETQPRMRSQPEPDPATLKRTKTGRRRLFGLFGRKHTEEPMLAPPSQASFYSDVKSPTSWQSQRSPPTPIRSNTSAGINSLKYKPLVARTNTEPTPPTPRSPRRKISNPIPIANSIDTTQSYRPSAPGEATRPLNSPSVAPLTIPGGGPFLNVEIPDVKMERYSVMFSGLLNPQNSSSLLARRQATLDRLKTINDCIIKEEEERTRFAQRAVTPPQLLPSKSPAFTLFPPTPDARLGPSLRTPSSPRSRSNTSPATLASPARSAYASSYDNREFVRGKSTHKTSHSSGSSRHLHPSARDRNAHFGQEQSSLHLESPISPVSADYERAQRTATQPSKPTILEPQWQMVSPPSSAATSSSTASSTRKRSPSSTSSVATNVTRPSVDADESENALKTAVEISIARQISISRQQRQMLRPLQTSVVRDRTALPTLPGARPDRPVPSPAKVSPVKLGKNERLQETKSSTPTLIHPPRQHLSAEQLMRHRKSEQVILDAA